MTQTTTAPQGQAGAPHARQANRRNRRGPKIKVLATCHPDKLVFERGMCRSCYWHKVEKPKYVKAAPIDFNALARTLGVNQAEAKKIFYTTINIVKEALQRGEKVYINKFGTFYKRPPVVPRPARNLYWGYEMKANPRPQIAFRPSTALAWLLNHPNFDPYAPPDEQDDRTYADLHPEEDWPAEASLEAPIGVGAAGVGEAEAGNPNK